jgi:predicted GNAT family N-acyltransferase
MSGIPAFAVRRVDWGESEALIRSVRTAVFIHEQNVPVELEWDGLDVQSLHVVAELMTGQSIGSGRLLPDGHIGHIGRMAVLRDYRGRGVGRGLLLELLALARELGFKSIELNAQSHAVGFYERLGFAIVSAEFMEAGIPHRTMRGG